CAQIGVKYLTLYTFSIENWKRPKDEVSTLMHLLLKSLKDRADELNNNDIKLTTIGDISTLPKVVQQRLFEDMERTKNNKRMTLNLALSYSGRWELINAIKNIAHLVEQGNIKPDDIDEKVLADALTTKDILDPDLLIRTR